MGKLSAGGEKQRCGWLQDKYSVSWQIIPSILGKLLHDPDPVKSARVMEAMLKMNKIDLNGPNRGASHTAAVPVAGYRRNRAISLMILVWVWRLASTTSLILVFWIV